MKIKPIIAAVAISLASITFTSNNANAMPVAKMSDVLTPPIEKTYGGCGINGHRGPWGGCRFGGQRQVFNARRGYYGYRRGWGYRRW